MTKEEIKKLANIHCNIAENIDFEFDVEERYYKGQSMVDKYNAFIAGFNISKEYSDQQNKELQLKFDELKKDFMVLINNKI